ncbi:BRO family, N-terminal domain [Nitrosomonas aestuarii]|uniref:BRO family, N-terminal domain n=1 Tax=Nitrosomonas aestuarii TaxID=52441 RepID=A0A1I4B5P4_9PROT|nr:BRO family protein [Nitrosomonas aestuarii]SFK64188.1 BRO family, N-terminal domain [Nitrosomonas aestuarii]
MNLTSAHNQDYSVHAPAKSGAGFDILSEAAMSRQHYAERLFYCLSVLVAYGRAEQGPQGRRCLTGMSTCSVPPTRLTSGSGSLNELEAHIMTATNSGAFAPVVFQFHSTSIRTFVDDHGEPWFCAKDVCDVLGYTNYSKAIKDHCREKGVTKRYSLTSGGNQELTFINEGNLYRLIIKSRKPEAEEFEIKLMDEILPTIRKTGRYQSGEIISTEQQGILFNLMAERFPDGRERPYGWSRFQNHFSVNSYKNLPASKFNDACAYIQNLPSKPVKALPEKRYNYPRKLLEQPYFTDTDRKASLSISMLTNEEQFTSQLRQLLNELRTDGHNIDAAWDEYLAINNGLKKASKFLMDVTEMAVRTNISSSGTGRKS